MASIRWLVARGEVTRGVAATAKPHLFLVLQRSASHWTWIFAPNKELAIRIYKEAHPL